MCRIKIPFVPPRGPLFIAELVLDSESFDAGEAPEPFYVETDGDDGEIIGSGATACEALDDARKTVAGWL